MTKQYNSIILPNQCESVPNWGGELQNLIQLSHISVHIRDYCDTDYVGFLLIWPKYIWYEVSCQYGYHMYSVCE